MTDHSLAKLLLQNLTDLLEPGDTLRLEPSGIALFHYGIPVAIGLEAVSAYLSREEAENE